MDSRTIDSGSQRNTSLSSAAKSHRLPLPLSCSPTSSTVSFFASVFILFSHYCMNPCSNVIFPPSPIPFFTHLPYLLVLLLSFSSLRAHLSSVMPGVHGTVYLRLRLFKFICGRQMSESVRASVYCQEHLQTAECVCIIFPLLVLSDICVCVYVLYS